MGVDGAGMSPPGVESLAQPLQVGSIEICRDQIRLNSFLSMMQVEVKRVLGRGSDAGAASINDRNRPSLDIDGGWIARHMA